MRQRTAAFRPATLRQQVQLMSVLALLLVQPCKWRGSLHQLCMHACAECLKMGAGMQALPLALHADGSAAAAQPGAAPVVRAGGGAGGGEQHRHTGRGELGGAQRTARQREARGQGGGARGECPLFAEPLPAPAHLELGTAWLPPWATVAISKQPFRRHIAAAKHEMLSSSRSCQS